MILTCRSLDPQYVMRNETQVKSLEIDEVTWQAIITASLRKLYGIFGEASHFDLVQVFNNDPRLQAIIRIHYADESKFINSLMAYTFKLNRFTGGDIEASSHVKVIEILPD
ncbi:Piso0_005737 [Millerozyma farinosa CBS 7064]|uniref:Piso0_005737 protein n=1 Tax=Pichia sorbitophila (strain ATCC MYA-4447 / BCRC 22081 / CBS 7064 / NBRC 10061 / NRRL Y-12695) TaxID=559304 RepID=G8Y2S7_PICSO|nr:Piso0_005737 [Millerozyma farinosa CBS 7064]